jgi:uncharacterized oxidoreductase
MPKIKADVLTDFVRDIFIAAGCSKEESARVGRYLVGANLAGHDSHGVTRVPRYVTWKQEGAIHADRKVKRVVDTPVLAILDGQFGFGQTIAPQAVEIGVEKCKKMGLAAVGLRNSGHVGRVGEWGEMAAAAGIVSIHFVNVVGSALVAPYGATDKRFSTAPYCIGIPLPGREPIILDFATSLVAEGKVLVASQGGKKIPNDALIDPDGKMSGDPKVLYGPYDENTPRNYRNGTGAIRAFGEHKGSGLAFMCETLAGALTGNGASLEERPWSQGMFSIYIDPKVVDPEEFFPGEMKRFIEYVKGSKPVKAGEPVLIPGEPELKNRAERSAHGISLPQETWDALIAIAREAGVDGARIQKVEIF